MLQTNIKVGSWKEQGPSAAPVRRQVFGLEQNIPAELEWDSMDELSLHAIAYDAQGRVCGTGRLLPDGHIGRMAVLKSWRGTGVGGLILETLITEAARRGDTEVVLHAQSAVEAFYLKHGFAREGAEFIEAGIAHVTMRRRLA